MIEDNNHIKFLNESELFLKIKFNINIILNEQLQKILCEM